MPNDQLPEIIPEGGMPFNSARHRLHDSVWVASLRHQLNEPNLFLYEHLQHKSWVLALWTRPPQDGDEGYMQELGKPFPANPDELPEFCLPKLDVLRLLLRQEKDLMKDIVALETSRRENIKNAKLRGLKHRSDVVKFLKRKANTHRQDHPSITGIETGAVPWITPELMEAETGQSIQHLLKGNG